MAQPTTVARFSAALQILYPEKKIRTYGMDNQPFWAYLNKKENFGGKGTASFPVQVSTGGRGSSHTFDDAQSGAGGADYVEFQYSRYRDYKIITFDNEALEASETDPGGYISLKKVEIDAALTNIVQRLAADLQSVDGNCGTIAAVSTVNNTIDVTQTDAVGLEIGTKLVSAPSTFTALRTSGGSKNFMVILKIDLDIAGGGLARIFLDTVNGDTALQYGVAVADRIYVKGNFQNSLDSTEKWVPSDRTQLATVFNNVDRSVYPSRLAGIYFDGSSYGLAECFERGLARAKLEGVTVDTIWLSPNRFTDLSLDAGSRLTRNSVKYGEFAFTTLEMNSAGGKGGVVKFVQEPNFKDTNALGTTKEAWKFHSLNGAPRNLTARAGQQLIIEPARDGWQIRFGWYGDNVCVSPRDNIRFKLPT